MTLPSIPKDLKGFVFGNRGDAFAPDRVGQELGGRRVAVCIMSDGIGSVGNARPRRPGLAGHGGKHRAPLFRHAGSDRPGLQRRAA